jgi:hypothetical protein
MKILLMLVALTVAPLGSIKAYFDANFSASGYEIPTGGSAYLTIDLLYKPLK